jgi:hypothetical protein
VVVISADQEGTWSREAALDLAATPAPRDVPTVSGGGVGAVPAGVAAGIVSRADMPVGVGT